MLGPTATGVAVGGVIEVVRSTTSGGGDRTERAGPEDVLVTGDSTIGVGAAASIGWPSERARDLGEHAQISDDGTCSHRFGTPIVSTTSCASTRGAPRHAVSRRAHSGRGRCSREHVGRDVTEHVVGRPMPRSSADRQRVDEERLDVHDTTRW